MSSLSGVNKPSSQYQPRPHTPSSPSSRVIYDPVTDKPQTIIDVSASGDVAVKDVASNEVKNYKGNRGITADQISITEKGISSYDSQFTSETVRYQPGKYGETPVSKTTAYKGNIFQESNLLTGESQFYKRESNPQSLSNVFSPMALEANRTSFEGQPGSSTYQERYQPVGGMGLRDVVNKQSIYARDGVEKGTVGQLNLENAFVTRPIYKTVTASQRQGAEFDILGPTTTQKMLFEPSRTDLPTRVGLFDKFLYSRTAYPIQKQLMFARSKYEYGGKILDISFGKIDPYIDKNFSFDPGFQASYGFAKESVRSTYYAPSNILKGFAAGSAYGAINSVMMAGGPKTRATAKAVGFGLGALWGGSVAIKGMSTGTPKGFGETLGKETSSFVGFIGGTKASSKIMSYPFVKSKDISITNVDYANTIRGDSKIADVIFKGDSKVRSQSISQAVWLKSLETKFKFDGQGTIDSRKGQLSFLGGKMFPESQTLISKRFKLSIVSEDVKPMGVSYKTKFKGIGLYLQGRRTDFLLRRTRVEKETLGFYKPRTGKLYYNINAYRALPLEFGMPEIKPRNLNQYMYDFSFQATAFHEITHSTDWALPKYYLNKFKMNEKGINKFYKRRGYDKSEVFEEYRADVGAFSAFKNGKGISFKQEFDIKMKADLPITKKRFSISLKEKSSPLSSFNKDPIPFSSSLKEFTSDGGFTTYIKTQMPTLKKESLSILSGTTNFDTGAQIYSSLSFTAKYNPKDPFAPKYLDSFFGLKAEQKGLNQIIPTKEVSSPEGEWYSLFYKQMSVGVSPKVRLGGKKISIPVPPKQRPMGSFRLESFLKNKRGSSYPQQSQVLKLETRTKLDIGTVSLNAQKSYYGQTKGMSMYGTYGKETSKLYSPIGLISSGSLSTKGRYDFNLKSEIKPMTSLDMSMKNIFRLESPTKSSLKNDYSTKMELKEENILKSELKLSQILKVDQTQKLQTKQLQKLRTRSSFVFIPPIIVPPTRMPNLKFGMYPAKGRKRRKGEKSMFSMYNPSLTAKPFKSYSFKVPKRLTGLEIRPIIR